MKKFLFFAFALVASVLAFTSCEGNNADNPLVGTWEYDDGNSILTVTFTADYKFDFRDYVYHDKSKDCNYFEGTYSIKGDIATAHVTGHGWYYDGEKNPVPNWEPEDEQMKFKVEGNQLTLTRFYGEDYAYTVTYIKQ